MIIKGPDAEIYPYELMNDPRQLEERGRSPVRFRIRLNVYPVRGIDVSQNNRKKSVKSACLASGLIEEGGSKTSWLIMGIFDLAALQNSPVVERSVKQPPVGNSLHIHCKSERGGREEKVDRSRVLDIASQLSEEDYGIAHQRRLLLRGGGRGDARVKGARRHPSLLLYEKHRATKLRYQGKKTTACACPPSTASVIFLSHAHGRGIPPLLQQACYDDESCILARH
ncbi:hypothetical protein BC827DRAFT_1154943 [Russula dissimulans]|nr:hypothetical protein BC827DRAFT_1154943 [Russula dissimulans]